MEIDIAFTPLEAQRYILEATKSRPVALQLLELKRMVGVTFLQETLLNLKHCKILQCLKFCFT